MENILCLFENVLGKRSPKHLSHHHHVSLSSRHPQADIKPAPTAVSLNVNSEPLQHKFNLHDLNPVEFLPRAASIDPDTEAICHRDSRGNTARRTYREFADRARGFAYHCVKHGRKRVAIICTNTPSFLYSIYGANAAGAIFIAVNYRLKMDDITYILRHSEADFIVVDREFRHLLADYANLMPEVPILVDDDDEECGQFYDAIREGSTYDQALGGLGWRGLQTYYGDELSVNCLAYTSGTTARPKGVELTHRGCYLATMSNIVEAGLSSPGLKCRYLWTLPMFHATGWTFPWAVTAVRGVHYCLRKIDYSYVWRLLKEENITHYCAAPTVNTLLCANSDADRLESPVTVMVAASPPSAHLLKTMTKLNLRPVHVYGMTETYGPATVSYVLDWPGIGEEELAERKSRQGHSFIGSLPLRVVKQDNPEGLLEDVARDGKEIGEVVFTGNICCRGYYKDAEATRKLFAGGALHSGDLAIWHPDGAIQIVDRAKDIIISGGENISSIKLESVIVTHPDVLECGVVAIPDEKWGECPKAYVSIIEGGQLSEQKLLTWCKDHPAISSFMAPKAAEVVSILPKTNTGKIRKNVLREWGRGYRDVEL